MRLDGTALREARERQGYSLGATAEVAGVAKHSVLRAEHGEEIRPVTARKIADALEVRVGDLLPKVESRFSPEPSFNHLLAEEERRITFKLANIALENHTAQIAHLLNTLPQQPTPKQWERGAELLEQMLTVIGADLEALESSGAGRRLVETMAAAERGEPLDEEVRQAATDLQESLVYVTGKISRAVREWITRSDEARELARKLQKMLDEQESKRNRLLTASGNSRQ